jgi:non-heme chloroperoxidase
MVKTAANPGGRPKEVFDGYPARLAANRAQFYYDVAAGSFYGYNRPGAKPSQGVIWNWWRQGMMGAAKAHSLLPRGFRHGGQYSARLRHRPLNGQHASRS